MRQHAHNSSDFLFHKKCSLLDAFQFVEKEKCPLLWREAMKLVIAMPTTGSRSNRPRTIRPLLLRRFH